MKRYIYALSKPKNILKKAFLIRKIVCVPTLLLLLIGSYGGLLLAPSDYQQGDYARIMYVHVPASWGALSIYSCMAIFSAIGLATRIPQYFLVSKAIAPIGATYCIISLITGSIWGKPTWGTFWVWDARLTSMFVLFLLYIGYIHLSRPHNLRQLVPASFVAVLGFINIPIIKGSVDWWYTLHQPATIQIFSKTSAIHSSMAWPLWIMALAFALYAIYLGTYRIEKLIHECKEKLQ
ncbi:MAG: heme ABC transporter permease CcmC [Candidatus Paracaedibacteraceae bacterium]|nr:heme ABC transporter permease CcmC [Candidatus Paracaedibacteraceae bacterium]